MADDSTDALDEIERNVPVDQIEVHWLHPRTELELPLLLVWPGSVVDEWAATVENGVATVVCHEWLADVGEGDETEVEKRAEEWGPDEPIPEYVADALLEYEGNYGPVTSVANPVPTTDDPPVEDYQLTLADPRGDQ